LLDVVRPRLNFRNPDYGKIFRERLLALDNIRRDPSCLPDLRAYYRDNVPDFISDWGITFEPRNVEIGKPSIVPMVLFDKQREFIEWIVWHWKDQTPGLAEKSRDVGATWCAVATGCALCIFYEGFAVGVGSRKGEYVDKIGTMKPILPKARMFMRNLPVEFRAGWEEWRDAPYMRLNFPDTGSLMTGEAGDAIGRGDRTSIYFVDEAAHLERPRSVDASLSMTTNCRIDMSSVNTMNNPFAEKRWSGKIDVFVFDWRDDPRKDEAWYKKKCEELDPVVVAQEIDRDYQASATGVIIPADWARACLDAAAKLGVEITGERSIALDVADEGIDKNAIVGGKGIEVSIAMEWSGKGSDILETTQHAFNVADQFDIRRVRYDADGIGAGVRGDARSINEKRRSLKAHEKDFEPFRGSEAVVDPEGIVDGTIGSDGDKGRTNEDYFANRKAQGWWSLRRRCERTWRWITKGNKCDPDAILSINTKECKNWQKLVTEMSQPTYKPNEVGKLVVNKKPDGMKSPNLGDGLMMRYAPGAPRPVRFTPDLLSRLRGIPRRRS
jgi:phage terminase large subunit